MEETIKSCWPPERWSDLTVLAAISGGPDSVALLRAMVRLRQPGPGRIVVAHFNHALRGADSDADERFVRDLAATLDLGCVVGRASSGTPGTTAGLSSSAGPHPDPLPEEEGTNEETARTARYEFLHRVTEQWGARFIATAHTADDQAETILHRIVRGTGLAGLRGIPRTRRLGPAVLIRPMLDVRRAEVIAYLEHLGQPWRTDATNAGLHFTRNRIRHELLPRLARQYNPAVVDALLRLGRLAGEAHDVIEPVTAQLMERYVTEQHVTEQHATEQQEGVVAINARPLNDQPRYVQRELLMTVWRRSGWPLGAMGFDQWDALADMLGDADIPSRTFPGAVQAQRTADTLRLTRNDDATRPS